MGSKRKRKNLKSKKTNQKQRRKIVQLESTIKLDDLHDDVLECIFKKLDLKDILNVADTSKRFIPAVELALKSKGIKNDYLSTNSVRYDGYDNMVMEIMTSPFKRSNVSVYHLSTALKLLRNFGHFFLNLHIDGSTKASLQIRDVINHYVSEYCSNYVEYLTIESCSVNDMKILEKPFPEVKHMTFKRCHLGTVLLERSFPNLKSLDLHDVTVTNWKFIEVNFPKLHSLFLRKVKITSKSFFGCLLLNPQITTLATPFIGRGSNFLQKVNEYLPSLRMLDIGHNSTYMPGFNDDYQMKNLNFFFIHLEKSFNNKELISYISKHPTITTLGVKAASKPIEFVNEKSDFLLKFVECVPFVEFIHLNGFAASTEDVIRILRECKALTFLDCTLGVAFDLNDLQRKLDNEWKILHVDSESIELEKEEIIQPNSSQRVDKCLFKWKSMLSKHY